MKAVTKLETKGMGQKEIEERIFNSLKKLKRGDVLKIVFGFNPLSIVYKIKTQDQFEVSFEKEGPPDWILNVKRIELFEDRKEKLRSMLKQLKDDNVSDDLKGKAKELFQAVDAKTIGLLEQELIQEGIPHDEIRKGLCDIHLEILKDALVSKRIEVSSPHPIHTFMEEHKIILDTLRRLDSLVERLKNKNNFSQMGEDIEILRDIAHHLVEAESHHQREEDVLFPVLERHDITEPQNIMKMDHVEFRERKKALYEIANAPDKYEFNDFKTKVVELGEYLIKELQSHIFKEDNILYQIALQVLNENEWDEVKRRCDKIGYCCFTPRIHKGRG